MQTLNNIDFNSIRLTRKLNVSCYDQLYYRLQSFESTQKMIVRAFELGASLDNQQKKKVCKLCQKQ
jgi:hypothetical protein